MKADAPPLMQLRDLRKIVSPAPQPGATGCAG